MGQRAVRLTGWPMALLMAAFYTGGMAVVWLFAEHDYSQTALLIRDVILALAVLVLMTLGIAWWSGLRIHRSSRIGWFGWLALIPILLGLVTLVASAMSGFADPGLIAVVVIGTALVGIGEETAFRGVIINALAARMTLPWAVVISSILFGLLHSVNVMLQAPGATVMQIVFTTFVGLFIGFTYVISGGNLILVVVLHWLWDLSLIASNASLVPVPGFAGLASVVILVLAMVGTAYGFIKMRDVRWDES